MVTYFSLGELINSLHGGKGSLRFTIENESLWKWVITWEYGEIGGYGVQKNLGKVMRWGCGPLLRASGTSLIVRLVLGWEMVGG